MNQIVIVNYIKKRKEEICEKKKIEPVKNLEKRKGRRE